MSTQDPQVAPPLMPRLAVVFVSFLVLAVVATWPLVQRLDTHLMLGAGRFDGYGTLWLGEHFTRVFMGEASAFQTTDVAFPQGLDLRLADSFLFGLLYPPFRVVAGPVAAFNLFSLSAIAATATAGWWLAWRVLGTRGWGPWLAGLVIGFNALDHTYRIEGEAYLLAGLFLPLFAGSLILTARSGQVRHALAAALWLGCLGWSSGYYAIDAVMLSVVLGPCAVAGVWGRLGLRSHGPAIGAFVLACLVLLLPLVLLVGAALDGALAARFPDGMDPLLNITLDSASVSGLLVPFDTTAHLRQGRTFYLGLACLVMAGFGVVVGRRRQTLPWLLLVLLGVVLSLGPFLRMDDTLREGARLPFAWMVAAVPSLMAYRMPFRFLALAFLGIGCLIALFSDRLRRDGLGWAWRGGVAAFVVFDVLIAGGFALDQTTTLARVPAAYQALSGKGALFELRGYDQDLLKFDGLSAYYQAVHGQPVMTDFTQGDDLQTATAQRLALALVRGDDDGAREVLTHLSAVGVSDLALHHAGLPQGDLVHVRIGLGRLAELTLAAPGMESDAVDMYFLDAKMAGSLDAEDALANMLRWQAEAS